MAIVFGGYSVNEPGGNGTSLTINKPSNTATGDLLVAGISVSTAGLTYTITPPSGWTSLGSIYTGGLSNSTKVELFYKIAGSSEPANYTFTFSVTASTRRGQISRFSGVDNTTPVDASGQTVTGSDVSVSLPSLTVSAGAVYYAYVRTNQDVTHTYQGSMTGQQLARHSFGYETISSSGSTGTRTVTFGSSAGYGAIVFAIKPDSSGGGGNNYDDSVSLSATKTVSDTSIVDFQVVTSLSLQRDVSDGSLANFQNSTNLGKSLIFLNSIQINFDDVILLSKNQIVSQIDLLTLFQTLGLLSYKSIITNAPSGLEFAINLQTYKSIANQLQIVLQEFIQLSANHLIDNQIFVVYDVSVLFNQLKSISNEPNFLYDESLSLSHNRFVMQLAFFFDPNIAIPILRVIPVLYEDRIFEIEQENRIISVLWENRTIPIGDTVMLEKLKHPNAVKDYKFDFAAFTNGTGASDWLQSGETITSYSISVPDGLNLDVSGLANSDTAVVIWLSGGTSGFRYDVSCQITTSAGRTEQVTFVLKVDENYL